MTLDPRLTPARPDLAAEYLRGRIDAARFVTGKRKDVIAPRAPMRRAPMPDAPLDTEALLGERVTVYETNDEGWAWVQVASDGYVGWIPDAALGAPGPDPTHRVRAQRTFVFPGASIKLPPLATLPLGACLTVTRMAEPFAVLPDGGHIPARHLVPVAFAEADFVAVAERFLDVPYLWGGKTGLGVDCSGLVQVALTACGVACLRDSDMQEAGLGNAIDASPDFDNLRRGDLVFWKGHVAIARDAHTLLHANAFHMAVVFEPVAEAVARIRAAGSGVTSIRRL